MPRATSARIRASEQGRALSGNPILQYRESRFPPLRNARVAGVHFLIPVPVRVPAAMGQATNSVRRHLLCLAFVGRQCKPPLAGPNGRIGQTPPYRTYRMCARVRACALTVLFAHAVRTPVKPQKSAVLRVRYMCCKAMCEFLYCHKFSTRAEDTKMLIGYARVSTEDQNLNLQRDALTAAGCERIFEDKASGARDDRPGLAEAVSHLRQGDCLVIWRLEAAG